MSRFAAPALAVLFGLTALITTWLWTDARSRARDFNLAALEAERSLEDVEAMKAGLEAANNELRDQLEELRNSPPVFSLTEEDLEDLRPQPSMRMLEEEPSATLASDEETESEPTPEEIAEREERERRREEWRQQREERRQAFRQQVRETARVKRDFFAQISTEGLTDEYKQAHADVLASLDYVEQLMAQMENPELERDQRRELMRELFQNARNLEELYGMQRDVLLNDYAQQRLGLDDATTQEFIEYMRTVDEMTSMGRPDFGPPGGGRGRGQGR